MGDSRATERQNKVEPTRLAPLGRSDPRRLGEWTLHGRLGAGGMGTVLLGSNEAGSLAAVKLIHPGLAADDSFRTRFAREVALTRRVAGAQVAEVLDADTECETPWLAVRYVPGPTLAEAISASGPMRGNQLESFALAVAVALEQIHAAGVVHRDLKPSNIVLSDESPVVIDFGIASAGDLTSITMAGHALGSMGWMSPEQIDGAPTGPPADVFSWGALVSYAGTGRPPFGTAPAQAVAHRVLTGAADMDGLEERWRTFCTAALAHDPADRPSPASLRRQITGSEEVSVATTRLEQAWVAPTSALPPLVAPGRAQRRGRSWVAGVGALVVAFAAVTAFALTRDRSKPLSTNGRTRTTVRAQSDDVSTSAPTVVVARTPAEELDVLRRQFNAAVSPVVPRAGGDLALLAYGHGARVYRYVNGSWDEREVLNLASPVNTSKGIAAGDVTADGEPEFVVYLADGNDGGSVVSAHTRAWAIVGFLTSSGITVDVKRGLRIEQSWLLSSDSEGGVSQPWLYDATDDVFYENHGPDTDGGIGE